MKNNNSKQQQINTLIKQTKNNKYRRIFPDLGLGKFRYILFFEKYNDKKKTNKNGKHDANDEPRVRR